MPATPAHNEERPLTAAEFRSAMLESSASLKNGFIGLIPEIRKAVREDTVEIVSQAIEEFSRLLDVKFDRIESGFNGKLEGISHQISGVNKIQMKFL